MGGVKLITHWRIWNMMNCFFLCVTFFWTGVAAGVNLDYHLISATGHWHHISSFLIRGIWARYSIIYNSTNGRWVIWHIWVGLGQVLLFSKRVIRSLFSSLLYHRSANNYIDILTILKRDILSSQPAPLEVSSYRWALVIEPAEPLYDRSF